MQELAVPPAGVGSYRARLSAGFFLELTGPVLHRSIIINS